LILANKQDVKNAQSLTNLCSLLSVPHLSSLFTNYIANPYNGKCPTWMNEGPLRFQLSSSIAQDESKQTPTVGLGKVAPESLIPDYSLTSLEKGLTWLVDAIKSDYKDIQVFMNLSLFTRLVENRFGHANTIEAT
jgi:hypothetical protein